MKAADRQLGESTIYTPQARSLKVTEVKSSSSLKLPVSSFVTVSLRWKKPEPSALWTLALLSSSPLP